MANLLALYTEEAVALGHPTKGDVINRANPLLAQCRLERVNATTIRLSRYNGKKIPVKNGSNWEYWEIPAAGVDLANTGLAASTLYYIYAKIAAATLTLESSVTASAVDADTGVRIKSADASRTLVGMIRTEGSTPGQFVDSITQRLTRSWFNRRRLPLFNSFTADRATASATFVELNTEIRVEFASWAGEMVAAFFTGSAHNSVLGNTTDTIIAVDVGTTAFGRGSRITQPVASYFIPCAAQGRDNALAEGYHFLTASGAAPLGGTSTWQGTAVDPRCSLSAEIGGGA